MFTMVARRLLLALAACHHVSGFGIMPSHETVNLLQQATAHFMHQASHHAHHEQFPALLKFLHHSAPTPVHHDLAHVLRQAPHDLLEKYTETLAQYPLPTKMATGATLAVAGDAIAQAKNDEEYDVRRASSFGVFDMAYRALQHASFPLIVASFHGQFLSSFFSNPDLAAAMEQTLASQLGIVPFIYYPAFFALTGAVQGLNAEAAVTRAKDNFLPLMKRNLMFWIPVQFIQFAFIQEDLQIPFLSICGLAWTFILSVNAGSTKSYVSEEAEVMTTMIELNAPPMYEMETAKVEEEEVDLRVVESVIR
jgi:protein Mpv17